MTLTWYGEMFKDDLDNMVSVCFDGRIMAEWPAAWFAVGDERCLLVQRSCSSVSSMEHDHEYCFIWRHYASFEWCCVSCGIYFMLTRTKNRYIYRKVISLIAITTDHNSRRLSTCADKIAESDVMVYGLFRVISLHWGNNVIAQMTNKPNLKL